MTALLWTLAILGAWNLANLIARFLYEEPPSYPHVGYIVFGAWAAVLLIMERAAS